MSFSFIIKCVHGFEREHIHPDLPGQFFHLWDLLFIVPGHKHAEVQKRRGGLPFLSALQEEMEPTECSVEIPLVTIFLIGFLRHAIQSKDENIQPGVDQAINVFLILEKMAVGAADHLDALIFGVLDHGKEILIDERFSPAPEMEEEQRVTHLIDELLKILQTQQPLRLVICDDMTYRTPEVTQIGWLDLKVSWKGPGPVRFQRVRKLGKKPIPHPFPGDMGIGKIDFIEHKSKIPCGEGS
jgi:hypothetical protein